MHSEGESRTHEQAASPTALPRWRGTRGACASGTHTSPVITPRRYAQSRSRVAICRGRRARRRRARPTLSHRRTAARHPRPNNLVARGAPALPYACAASICFGSKGFGELQYLYWFRAPSRSTCAGSVGCAAHRDRAAGRLLGRNRRLSITSSRFAPHRCALREARRAARNPDSTGFGAATPVRRRGARTMTPAGGQC